ncbi:hypothetical protein J4G48_0015845 [Bradyrhizobium barranii subsp. apii]|uniref:hypothetical protein n=1 Tax=Bradyrhizobium barranii TaxID=2992140 RepID=UPI001AA1B242|nr:hypothetical protein [Bradyrhizobium barranii]UPT99428.1 hypothetical protein J4G48_0015845 [Bradyrhizobium barranii subsp. apii]
MDQAYNDRLQEFGQAYEDFEAADVRTLIVRTGERLAALCLDEGAVNKAMICLHRALDLSDPSTDRAPEGSWKALWDETSAVELLDLPLTQKLTSLNAYAYFGLSPAPDGGPCTLADIKRTIDAVSAALSLSDAERPLLADTDRTLSAAQARYALDEGSGLLPDQLAALVRLGQKSMRNTLAPSSGSGLEIKDGKITATSALTWLKARGDFKSSVWRQASAGQSAAKIEPPLAGEVLWVPFASDDTDFDPAKCLRSGKYTVGPKGAEIEFTDYRQALDALARMKPAAYWRRPNSAGNWGIVTAVGFRPRSAEELGIAASQGDEQ